MRPTYSLSTSDAKTLLLSSFSPTILCSFRKAKAYLVSLFLFVALFSTPLASYQLPKTLLSSHLTAPLDVIVNSLPPHSVSQMCTPIRDFSWKRPELIFASIVLSFYDSLPTWRMPASVIQQTAKSSLYYYLGYHLSIYIFVGKFFVARRLNSSHLNRLMH